MAVTTVILLQLMLVSLVSASHYISGSMTFIPKGRSSNGTFKIEIRNKETYHYCSSEHSWYCYEGNCGFEMASQSGDIDMREDDLNYENMWCETETVMTRVLPNDKPFELGESGCCWTQTRTPGGYTYGDSWRLQTFIDLGKRSDTGRSNRSPVTGILPFLRVPENCPRAYRLMSFDPDGDSVRYRYGVTKYTECYSCHQFDEFYLDQDSGTLYYLNSTASDAVYGFELVVEDFPQEIITLNYTDGTQCKKFPLQRSDNGSSAIPNATTTNPTTTMYYSPRSSLSKLPLQFSLLVDPAAPSCVDGQYVPRFKRPTPEDGARVHAQVNREIELKIMAEVAYGTIDNIYFTGPLHSTKHKTTNDEFFIRWTPTESDVENHFAICFVVESHFSDHNHFNQSTEAYPHNTTTSPKASLSRVYQSEMRCVLVHVGSEEIKTNVSCEGSQMRLTFETSSIPNASNIHLMFRNPNDFYCSLYSYSNSTHITAIIPLYSCGTHLEEDEDNLIFKNEIVATDSTRGGITRRTPIGLNFYCQYPRKGTVQQSFKIHRRNVTVWDKGFGTLTYSFEFYPNDGFGYRINPDFYPLEYDLGDRIYMEIDVSFSYYNIELFVESCKATPYDNQYHGPSYTFIKDGCAVDSTVRVYHSYYSKRFRFSIEVFDFIEKFDQVYISCSVMVCDSWNYYTRCSKGCLNRVAPTTPFFHRRKRDVSAESGVHVVSQGPLRLKRSAKSTVTNLNLSVILIAGCVLVTVGIICLKMSRPKWQLLRKFRS